MNHVVIVLYVVYLSELVLGSSTLKGVESIADDRYFGQLKRFYPTIVRIT